MPNSNNSMRHRVASSRYPVSDGMSSEEEQETIEYSSNEEEEPVEWVGEEEVRPVSPTGIEVSRQKHWSRRGLTPVHRLPFIPPSMSMM